MQIARHGLLRRLMLSYSLIFMAIVLAAIALAYRYIVGVSEKTAQINQSQLADKMAVQVEDTFNEMLKMGEQVRTDERIINVFSRLQTEKDGSNYFENDILQSIDIGSVLTSYNGPNMLIWRISVYNQYGDYICSGAPTEPQSRVSELCTYSAMQDLMDTFTRVGTHTVLLPPSLDRWSGVYDAQYLSLLLPITNYYGSAVYGVVEIQQPVSTLESRMRLDVLSEMQVFLLDENGTQVWPDNLSFSSVESGGFSIVKQPVADYGWTVALAQSRESMMRPYTSVLWFLLVGGAALVLLLMLVIYVVSRRISTPLVRLSQKVREASVGNLPSNWVTSESTDEVKELGQAFTTMLTRITDSINFEKKAYLQALQSQMNPHFLFNSLSLLSGMGMEAGSDQIVDTCEKISGIMRYSADTSASTLGSEIDNLHNYLALMKLRYEKYFSYSIEMDPGLDLIPLPRLVFQPIVENCFEHGFKPVPPPWRIEVSVRRVAGGWVAAIADNGAGFDAKQREEMEEKVKKYAEETPENYAELKIGGLGLANTIIRLQFFGGAQCTIRDNTPCGTVVTISSKKND